MIKLQPKTVKPLITLVKPAEQVLSFEERTESILIPDKNGSFTIHKISKTANDIQAKCRDFEIVQSAATTYVADNMQYVLDGIGNYNFTEHSLSQLCNRLEVPFSYIRKCCTDTGNDKYPRHQSLAVSNLNTWLKATNKDYFVRTYDSQVRGLLSRKYTPFDVPNILNVVGDTIDFDQYDIKGFNLNPERFHMRLVEKTPMLEKDDIFGGIQIDSSDVGRSRLTVQFFIYKLVCTNGLVRAVDEDTLFMQRHIGITFDQFAEEFVASIERLPSIVADAKASIEYTSKLKVQIPQANPEKFTEKIKGETGLSTEIINKGIELMHQNYAPTMWGLINGLTEVSKEYTLEKRLDIEKRAGLLLVA